MGARVHLGFMYHFMHFLKTRFILQSYSFIKTRVLSNKPQANYFKIGILIYLKTLPNCQKRKNHKKIGFWAKNGELIEALASQLNRPGYQSTNYLFLIEVPSRTAKSTLSLLVAFPSQLRYMPSRSTSGRGLVEGNGHLPSIKCSNDQ